MLIVNYGGRLNQRFDSSIDNMKLFQDNKAIYQILESLTSYYEIQQVNPQDDLDKNILIKKIIDSEEKSIIITHDLVDIEETAKLLLQRVHTKLIILIGIKQPFEINRVEASFCLGLSIGFAQASNEDGIYICQNKIISQPLKK